MLEKVRKSAYSSPLYTAILVALFAVVLFSFPNLFEIGETAAFILHIVCRVLAVFFAVLMAKACGFKFFAKPKFTVFYVLLFVIGVLVCANNFPVIGFATGNVALNENAKIARYLVYCAAIGVAEEFVFRGAVMPLVGMKFREKAHAPFLTVLVTSAVFSLCHLFNVFSAGIGPTLLQVGYTFLTGGLFCAAYLFTENLVFPVILHTLFDVGGLMFSPPFGIASGNMWDLITVIITAVLGVAATAVYALALWNYKKKEN